MKGLYQTTKLWGRPHDGTCIGVTHRTSHIAQFARKSTLLLLGLDRYTTVYFVLYEKVPRFAGAALIGLRRQAPAWTMPYKGHKEKVGKLARYKLFCVSSLNLRPSFTRSGGGKGKGTMAPSLITSGAPDS